MERRNRDRLNLSEFCRLAPASNRRRTSWKRIENISGAGMLLAWSTGEPDVKPPHVGDVYVVQLQLPAHPVFGQRALQYKAKVVRVLKQPNGRVMAAFESSQTRFKSIRGASWAERNNSQVVN
jgi:hypothetical protein